MESFLDLYLQFNVPSPIEEATWQEWFEAWLGALNISEPCELSLCLTTDEHICELNRAFRHIDQPTDVLAFAAQEAGIPDLSLVMLLGDIIISVPTARIQARAQGHKLSNELAWLAAHGLLHLLGWDHPDELSLHRMLQQQRRLMEVIHLSPEVTYGV